MTRQDWRTAPSLFGQLNRDFGPFVLDVAADDDNHLCARYYTEKTNGLVQPWGGRWFCNMPFGRPLPWVQKADEETRFNNASGPGVMLCQAGLSTRWFELAIDASLILVPDRRVNYWHPDESPFNEDGRRRSFDRPSVILVFGTGQEGRIQSYHVPPHMDEVVSLWELANAGVDGREIALRSAGCPASGSIPPERLGAGLLTAAGQGNATPLAGTYDTRSMGSVATK